MGCEWRLGSLLGPSTGLGFLPGHFLCMQARADGRVIVIVRRPHRTQQAFTRSQCSHFQAASYAMVRPLGAHVPALHAPSICPCPPLLVFPHMAFCVQFRLLRTAIVGDRIQASNGPAFNPGAGSSVMT